MARLPHNVEPSAFKPGTYKCYDGRGFIWYVTRTHARKGQPAWFARPAPNNPSASMGVTRRGDTLTALAAELATRQTPRVIEPF